MATTLTPLSPLELNYFAQFPIANAVEVASFCFTPTLPLSCERERQRKRKRLISDAAVPSVDFYVCVSAVCDGNRLEIMFRLHVLKDSKKINFQTMKCTA